MFSAQNKSFEEIGIIEGLKRGSSIGEIEGLWYGLIHGFDTAAEAAYYWGAAVVWLSVFDWIPKSDKCASKRCVHTPQLYTTNTNRNARFIQPHTVKSSRPQRDDMCHSFT